MDRSRRSAALLSLLTVFFCGGAFVGIARGQSTQPTTKSSIPADRIILRTGTTTLYPPEHGSKLEFTSSEPRLNSAFQWAKTQAMAYVFDGDPVGPWYEAVEPGREGFCIRDTCHQALGAQALGLAKYNLNMLRRFAENVSDSKDWCSYWEIDRNNRPAPVDYKNDAEFWYNLPANFDLVDCCYRMYVWTGDQTYISDPAFVNLYDRTVADYVTRWGLGIDQIMTRPRLLNVRGIFDPKAKFPKNRGIPGYNEGDHTYVVGFDVIATQYAAYQAYANLQAVRGNAELYQTFMDKAAAVKALAEKSWWDEQNHSFYSKLNKDYKPESSPADSRRSIGLDWGTVPYDDPDADTAKVMDLEGARLEYPETSFTRIGTIVGGTMGINLVFSPPLLASVKGNWVEMTVKTLPGLGSKVAWAEIRNLPIRSNEVRVRHEGMRKTTLTNQRGPAIIWLAAFRGSHETLLLDGKPEPAHLDKDSTGQETSSIRIAVGAGGVQTVEVPE